MVEGAGPAQQPQMPEAVLRSPYPQTAMVYSHLCQNPGPTTVREISTSTGIGEDTVRRVVRYLRRKGVVRVRTVRQPGGKKAIRWMELRQEQKRWAASFAFCEMLRLTPSFFSIIYVPPQR